jgi:hypothetical protein
MSVRYGVDSNPMHALGHGRGDDHKPEKTETFSFAHGAIEVFTVIDIVHRFIEQHLQAWLVLPESIRDRMLAHPQDFQFAAKKERKEGDFNYDIIYNGTVWRYYAAGVWTIVALLQ